MNVDDPKLTAYAIGELPGEERAEVEAFLAANADARATVIAIRETAATLTAALAMEQSAGLGDERLAELLEAGEAHPLRLRRDDVYHVITHPVPEPRRLRTSLLALAAAIAIVVTTLSILVSTVFRDHFMGPRRIVAGAQQSTRPTDYSDYGGAELASPRGLFELLPEAADAPRSTGPNLTLLPVHNAPTTRDARNAESPGYALEVENPFQDAARNPVSTVPYQPKSDSYEAVKQYIASGHLPQRGSVRVEQLINAFNYGYAAPVDGSTFATYTEVASCPWNAAHRLVRIGLKAREESDPDAKVADDMRVSVEFNPQKVSAYRLIGFDRRMSTRAPGADPSRSVQSGQALTALYEVIPAAAHPTLVPLKYQQPPQPTPVAMTPELLTLNLQYKTLAGATQVQQSVVKDDSRSYVDASADFRFAAAVASFGLILTDSPHKGTCSYDQVLALADSTKGLDLNGEQATFRELVRRARTLQ